MKQLFDFTVLRFPTETLHGCDLYKHLECLNIMKPKHNFSFFRNSVIFPLEIFELIGIMRHFQPSACCLNVILKMIQTRINETVGTGCTASVSPTVCINKKQRGSKGREEKKGRDFHSTYKVQQLPDSCQGSFSARQQGKKITSYVQLQCINFNGNQWESEPPKNKQTRKTSYTIFL